MHLKAEDPDFDRVPTLTRYAPVKHYLSGARCLGCRQ